MQLVVWVKGSGERRAAAEGLSPLESGFNVGCSRAGARERALEHAGAKEEFGRLLFLFGEVLAFLVLIRAL